MGDVVHGGGWLLVISYWYLVTSCWKLVICFWLVVPIAMEAHCSLLSALLLFHCSLLTAHCLIQPQRYFSIPILCLNTLYPLLVGLPHILPVFSTSFPHTGTSFLMRSTISLQASMAALRCGEEVNTNKLISPAATAPRLW